MRKQPTPEQRRCSPVDEPGAGVVGSEADSDVITSSTNVDGVAANRVNVVVRVAASTANDIESVLDKTCVRCSQGNGRSEPYPMQVDRVTTTDSTTGDGNLYRFIRGETIDATGREKVSRCLGTAENLEKDGDAGRLEGNAVDSELEEREVLGMMRIRYEEVEK